MGSWSSSESDEVKIAVEIRGSLGKGKEVTSSMVAMPVEPPYWCREEGKLIKSEAWSPSFIDRLPFAELYSGDIPFEEVYSGDISVAFFQGLGNVRSMLHSQ